MHSATMLLANSRKVEQHRSCMFNVIEESLFGFRTSTFVEIGGLDDIQTGEACVPNAPHFLSSAQFPIKVLGIDVVNFPGILKCNTPLDLVKPRLFDFRCAMPHAPGELVCEMNAIDFRQFHRRSFKCFDRGHELNCT